EHDRRSHPRVAAAEPVARVAAFAGVGAVQHAAERFGPRRLRERNAVADRQHAEVRQHELLGETAGQAGDAVFAVERALVAVPGRTVLAGRLAPFAAAVAALVDDDAVADRDVVHRAAALHHRAGDL